MTVQVISMSVNEARKQLFTHKGRTIIDGLPPTQDALDIQHVTVRDFQ